VSFDDKLLPILKEKPKTPAQRYTAREVMDSRAFDPISRMIDLAEDLEQEDKDAGAAVNADKRLKIYTALAKYQHPQPKSVDINVTSNDTRTLQVVSFKDLIQDRQHMIPEQSVYEGPKLAGIIEEEVESD
jgi:hypothetical protein